MLSLIFVGVFQSDQTLLILMSFNKLEAIPLQRNMAAYLFLSRPPLEGAQSHMTCNPLHWQGQAILQTYMTWTNPLAGAITIWQTHLTSPFTGKGPEPYDIPPSLMKAQSHMPSHLHWWGPRPIWHVPCWRLVNLDIHTCWSACYNMKQLWSQG